MRKHVGWGASPEPCAWRECAIGGFPSAPLLAFEERNPTFTDICWVSHTGLPLLQKFESPCSIACEGTEGLWRRWYDVNGQRLPTNAE
ncbi:hypothetical protein F7734_42755 [Scytonema sp. UIC 10036]|uniref:hypothetical protein n=1 Tax=Scytonema sp. UIC 10036 TaxID=2304196 RepID=UPI0012DAB947|nr:hypothetical protein [Scytonema sp. UIC 10036]MUG98656.1 hypothetical protein [Scytonema sp. UIC 10036]